jgi:hypothetical protein
LSELRQECTESGVIKAVKDITDYFTAITGESYLKNRNSSQEVSKFFLLGS